MTAIGYNVRLRRKEKMRITSVIATALVDSKGKRTGNFRYRLAGTGSDGTKMSRFVKKADANRYSCSARTPIVTRLGKPIRRRVKRRRRRSISGKTRRCKPTTRRRRSL